MTRGVGWEQLLALPAWAPLSTLEVRSTQLAGVLHELDIDTFVLAVPYREDLVRDPLRGPFLTAVLWAVSRGAALRVVERQLEADDQATRPAPIELLPSGATATYSSILKGLSVAGQQPAESARYRMVPDGKYLARTVHTARWTYFFRKREDDDDDAPFAIQYSLAGGTRRRTT